MLYRISRNSGRGSYHFVGQILPQNWGSAVFILGAVIIKLLLKYLSIMNTYIFSPIIRMRAVNAQLNTYLNWIHSSHNHIINTYFISTAVDPV